MPYTEYLFDPEWVAQEVAIKRANLKANKGDDVDLLKFGLQVVANRLKKDPMRCRDYGPYWWALKAILRVGGYRYGSADDPLLKAVYVGGKPVETLVMAEAFRDDYLATHLRYANEFVLDSESAELVQIIDPDMEGR